MKQRALAHPTMIFFLLTCLWSWVLWIPGVVIYNQQGLDTLPIWIIVLGLLGSYGPTVGALATAYLRAGSAGVSTLVRKLTIWRVHPGWYLFVCLLFPALLLVAIAMYPGDTGLFKPVPALPFIPLVLLTALPFGPLGEELGWRGFAQPTLQTKQTVLTSALIVGLMWGIWHIPLFWFPGAALSLSDTGQLLPMLMYIINTMLLSILYALVLNHTRQSVLLAILFHLMINATARIIYPMFVNIPDEAIVQISDIQFVLVALTVVVCSFVYRRELLASRAMD